MAALVPVVDSLDKVPEAARGFYVQKDGKYQLELDGAPAGFVPAADLATANGRIVEFRTNNINLTREVEELRPIKVKVGDLDIDAARTALTETAALKAKGVTKPDDIAKIAADAAAAAVKPVMEQLQLAQTKSAENQKRADDAVFRTTISEKFLKAGGLAKALDYIVNQASDTFAVVDGTVKAKDNKVSADRPGELLGIDEWIVSASRDHDFAFAASAGGGSRGSNNSGGGVTTLKPGQTLLKDPTPQQLGEHGKDILKGKIVVQYSNSDA